ncbi:hypothetical protein IEQ34_010383 [Dendrobium chrysotoxum]|uniref:Ubiquitin carboxyl-terminal hydrolase n=1 Tax=Dendrobium chrysotoxum TaxID=161865 RepID=A0AAV7H4B2_DENCH|nr:hypothetical protein IEQ34_010383 [Dendrobium chrysotoxum]
MMAVVEEAVQSTADAQMEMQRENEIYLAKRQYSAVPASLGELRLENLKPGSSGVGAGAGASGGGVGVVEVTNAKRSVLGEFYEHGFDPEFSFRIRFQKIGAGLENMGNTCYLNSVLQCLTYTEPFAAYLQSGKHKSTCRNAGFCAMCALQNHVMVALQSTGKILRPFHLVKNLRRISSNFRNSRQEDAHEYMVNLLESMHKCCLPHGVSSESPSAYEKSQVHKIFGGQLRSQVKCMQCSYCSNKFDPFLDLSLEILKADSLRKALTHFTAVELLDGGERQYQCQRCEEKVKAFKQLTIHKAPYVLTIHLKRFDSSINGEKLSKKVVYGPTLNLNPFISDPREGDYRYTLYGVLVHAGWTTYSGHYFCYVRTSAGMWYSLDDNQVTEVSEKTVLSREAYMLFYVRDRTVGVKGAVEVSPKPDISSSATGNKTIPVVERKPSTAVYTSVHTRHDETSSELVPALGALSQKSVKHEGPLFHGNVQVETKCSCLQGGDSNNHKKTPSKGPAKSLPLMDSKLPSNGDDKKSNFANDNAQDGALAHRMETDHPPPPDDVEKVLRQSNTMNDSIQMEAVGTRLVDNQNNGPKGYEFESCSSNLKLQKGGESFLKLLETKSVESLLSCATVCSVQLETHSDIITENLLFSSDQTESKLKKPRKSSSANGWYFGRKQLFFMSLHLPKNKRKGSKKLKLIFRKKISRRIVDDLNNDSHGASTSETFQAINFCSRHPPRKHSHFSTYRKSKGKEGIKLGRSSVHNNEFNIGMKTLMLEASNKPSRFCSSEGDSRVKCKNAEEKNIQKLSVNLLMTSLKQTSVASWDDNFPAEKMNQIEYNSKRNIGCILDECDEDDQDKDKRKKVKKSRQWFGVVEQNPFQETAIFKTQQKRPKNKDRAEKPRNQPFRILR